MSPLEIQFWPVVWSVIFIVVVSGISLLISHWPQGRDNVELPDDETDGDRPEYREALCKSKIPG